MAKISLFTLAQIEQVYSNVHKFGGSFVKSLMSAHMRADAENALKIEQAFPEVFNKYLHFGESKTLK